MRLNYNKIFGALGYGASATLLAGGGLALNQWSNDVFTQEVACQAGQPIEQAANNVCDTLQGRELVHNLRESEIYLFVVGSMAVAGGVEGVIATTNLIRSGRHW